VLHAEFGHSRLNRTSLIIEICQKIFTITSPPFKITQGQVIGTATDRSATYDFLLVFIVTIALSRTVSEITIFANFSRPLYLTPLRRGTPWNFVTPLGYKKKLDWYPIRMSINVAIYPFVLIQYRHWTNRQTDKRTDRYTYHRALHALHADTR